MSLRAGDSATSPDGAFDQAARLLRGAGVGAPTLRARAVANGASIGRQQSREVDARRLRPREPRRSLTLVDEIHETRDQPVTASRGRGHSTSPSDGVVRSGDEPIVGPLREPLEATDARRRRQIGERPAGAEADDDGNAQQARDPFVDRRRSLGDFRLADIVDRPFQPPRRRCDRYLRGAAQIETAARADILRDQVRLSERSYPAAAGGTSVPQAAAMPEAGNPRGESPRPPKIRSAILGKTQSAKLGPGRTAPAGGLAQRQQKRRQRPLRHRHRRYRLGRNARPNAEPGREYHGEAARRGGATTCPRPARARRRTTAARRRSRSRGDGASSTAIRRAAG